jgi:putative addiction module component (TIGR02574 family)
MHLSDVLALPVSERLKLVEAIWDSIADASETFEPGEAQRAELDRRLEDYGRNPDAGCPWAEVKARLLKEA